MEHDVYVLQVVTDGPKGYPDDEVADVGICAVDLGSMEAESVYSMYIHIPDDRMDDIKREYLGQSGITPAMLSSGTSAEQACIDVKGILKDRSVASFDIRNVFYRYMVNEPWDLTKETSVMPSISSRLPTSQRNLVPAEENSKISHAYRRMFPGDPMDIGTGRRALDHALMSAAILMALRERGKY